MLDQPSLTYDFSVSSLMLKDGKKIQVRLNAEHGDFMYLVAVDKVPDFDTKDFGNNEDAWVGGDLKNVIIQASDLDSKLEEQISQALPKRENDAAYSDELIHFYIRVYPYVLE